MRLFLSGNEAIAQACVTAHIDVATGYPGTPSTEIIETIKNTSQIQASWNPNEKVALEVAIGASFVGGRAICTMKHVGLNVAADPLMTLSYTGVGGGLVIVSCDDPGMWSSQNEQDNRHYARFAKIPMLEPSSSQEAYDYLIKAIELSETYDTPVLLRMTTRICHGKGEVFTTNSSDAKKKFVFRRNVDKHLMLPKQARKRHFFVEKRLGKLKIRNWEEESLRKHIERGSDELIVCSGVAYQYVMEVCDEKDVLKLGFTYPLPKKELKALFSNYKKLSFIEELDPFLEEELLSVNSQIQKRPETYYLGELTPKRVEALIEGKEDPGQRQASENAPPPPPPAMCSGCPHLTIFNLFRNLDLNVSGDIGCYTLAALPPFNALHSVVEMGASIPMATGAKKLLSADEVKKTVAVIGDSTFFHSGIQGLMDAVQHRAKGVIAILDNRVTAMTGGQAHPGSDTDLDDSSVQRTDYEALVRAIGVKYVKTLDPYNFRASERELKLALEQDELCVLILKRECALISSHKQKKKYEVLDSCVKCGDCLQVGCPAIRFDEGIGHPMIDVNKCTGCDICAQVCEHESIQSITEMAAK